MSRAEREKWERVYGVPERVHGLEPTPFLVEAVRTLADSRAPTRRRALVLAMGEGRNAAFLASAGYVVDGIDISFAAVRKAKARVQSEGRSLHSVVADLDDFPLPVDRYDLVCVANFLARALFEPVARAVRPGGAIVWETFTRAHAAIGSPRNPAHLLGPGELRARFADFDLRRYREVILDDGGKRRAIASLFATRRPSSV